MLLLRALLVLVALSVSSPCWALDSTRSIAQFRHKSWSTVDGMPADIWSITQMRDGYLLLGSVNGLFRFDGINIEQLATNLLPSPSIHTLAVTPDGGLWIGYERNIAVISLLKNGKVTNYPSIHPARPRSSRSWSLPMARPTCPRPTAC